MSLSCLGVVNYVRPTLLSGVTRISSRSAFGVILADDLDANGHVNDALASCSRSLYEIRVLKSRDLPPCYIGGHQRSINSPFSVGCLCLVEVSKLESSAS